MALTQSNMLALGTPAPDFTLPNGNGIHYSLADCRGSRGLLVAFICNHCPFVKHLNQALADCGCRLEALEIGMVAINANDVSQYPQDSPARMLEVATRHGYPFPYLYDETQQTARAYSATCTPDFFLFDQDLKLAYRGRFDNSSPGNNQPITGSDLYAAAEALAAGKPVEGEQFPSMGCNIKWKQA